MKKVFFNITLLLTALLCLDACQKDEDNTVQVRAEKTGTFVDERDGYVYHYAQFGDTDWMIDNSHFFIDDETVCEKPVSADDQHNGTFTDKYVPRYGYCYTYSGALQACPKGWRVPTDKDWQKLEKLYGMSNGDAESRGWRGSCAYAMREITPDSTTLGILMTGYNTTYTIMQTPDFRLLGCFGFFWTSSSDAEKSNEYFYRKFAYNRKEVYRESTEDGHIYFFVRFCRDAK